MKRGVFEQFKVLFFLSPAEEVSYKWQSIMARSYSPNQIPAFANRRSRKKNRREISSHEGQKKGPRPSEQQNEWQREGQRHQKQLASQPAKQAETCRKERADPGHGQRRQRRNLNGRETGYDDALEPKLAEKLKSRNISFDQTNIGGTFSNNQSVHINSQNCHIEPDISTIQNSVQAPQQPPLQERTARTIYMGTARTNPTKLSKNTASTKVQPEWMDGMTASLCSEEDFEHSYRSNAPLNWKQKYDDCQIYNLNKRFALSDPQQEEILQTTKWNEKDLKGKRQFNYIKEVSKKNSSIMTIVQQSRLEQAHNYTDGHKCLNLRKKIMKFKIHISDAALAVTSHKFFEGFIILVIGLNCITLAQSDSTREETPVEKQIDLTFNIIYTIEMVLRVCALGFVFNTGAYLRSYWNQLDFICVCTAYLEIVGGGGTSLAALRAFRVLRPLRFVNNIEGLKIVVSSVMAAIPVLQDTIVVLFFFFLVFAIGGLNLFMGQLKQRCVSIETGQTFVDEEGEEIICGSLGCPVGYFCGRQTLNPQNDVTNFDNIFWALLNVFQCITMEGWSEIMVMYQQAYTPWTFFFFVPMVFIGAFFLLNLLLAVIQTSYQTTQKRIKEEKRKLKEEQLAMTETAKKKSGKGDDDEDMDVYCREDPNSKNLNIGVMQFFIAQRAVKKLKFFVKQWKVEQEEKAVQNKIKEEEELKIFEAQKQRDKKMAQTKILRQKSLTKSMTQRIKDEKNNSQQSPRGGSVDSPKKFADLHASTDQRRDDNELDDRVIRVLKRIDKFAKTDDKDKDSFTEDSISGDETRQDDVHNFLKKLGSETELMKQHVPEFANQHVPELSKTNQQAFNPVMAFSDVRIQGALDNKIRPQDTGELTEFPMSKGTDPNHTIFNDRVNQTAEKHARGDTAFNKILLDLDFDTIVKSREDPTMREQSVVKELKTDYEFTDRDLKGQVRHENIVKDFDDLFGADRPLDFSALSKNLKGRRSANGYASDNDKPPRSPTTRQNFGDKSVSISISEASILDTIQQRTNEINDTDEKRKRSPKRGGFQTNREVPQNLKRLLTSRFKDVHESVGDDSTFQGVNQSFRQQIDCLSNLQPNRYDRQNSRKKQSNSLKNIKALEYVERQSDVEQKAGQMPTLQEEDKEKLKQLMAEFPDISAQALQRKILLEKMKDAETASQKEVRENREEKKKIYNQIDKVVFTSNMPTNPVDFMNNAKQKSIINPGVPYVSTSQHEIFEIRNLRNAKLEHNKQSQFIAPPEDDTEKGLYEGKKEESYIVCMHDPYQLKMEYKVKKVVEIEFDSDDEDAVVLAQQPYETVMGTGFQDYLNHLSTKFLARRSDIIVTSTLSLTLTPEDDGYVPAQFALIDEPGIWEYVMKRQEYRAMAIQSNQLKSGGHHNYSYHSSAFGLTLSDQTYESEQSEDEDEYHDTGMQQSVMTEQKLGRSIKPATVKLPVTLLSRPIRDIEVTMLSKKEKRTYNQQKQKWEAKKKQLEKIEKNDSANLPSRKEFSIQDARLLIKGLYKHADDEDDLDQKQPVRNLENETKNLNRAMIAGKDDPQHEMNLDNFESKVQKALIGLKMKNQGEYEEDPREFKDNVPEALRQEFTLPKDMHDCEIDFEQVRISDAQIKRRKPEWSGQEVLDLSLNLKKSAWVLAYMNKLRVWPKGFYNYTKKYRAILKSLIYFKLFDNFLTVCVLINTVVMAMDSYDIDAKTAADLEFLNNIFTWIFIVEMFIKLMAIGPSKYAANKMNLLDGGVVLLSIVEIVMAAAGGGGGGGNLQAFRTVRVFRTFRVLRVTRVLRALKSMAMVIDVMNKAMTDFLLITMLMFVFIFIYTLLGRQIFQGQYNFGPDEELPRGNFESFSVAFITVFQVLTMENWQQVLFTSMRAAEGSMIFKTVTALYYISWIFIGNFILLNLFLAVLIDAFAESNAEMEKEDQDQQKVEKEQQRRYKEEKNKRMKKLGTSKKMLRKSTASASAVVNKSKKKKTQANFTGQKRIREEDIGDIEEMTTQEVRKMLVDNGFLKARKEDKIDKKLVGPEIHAENSLYLFNRNDCFRRNVHFIQQHKKFENFIMLLIALSSTKLALESYLVDMREDNQMVIISNELDFIFNYLFIVECVLKIIALGFAMDEGSYMRDSWNRLDFFIVVTSIIDMMLTNTDIPALKVLRMLRMIRPLRVISHNPQLKMIVAALFESVGSIINVSFIVMIIWLMFAIYGMNTFMGMFFYCTEDKYRNNTKWVCEAAGGEWLRWDSNFDSIGQAMLTLFVVASLEGWPDIMYQAIDVTKRDNGPKYEHSPGQTIFFVLFILIGSFFFLNFFIGVLFLEYEKASAKDKKGFSEEHLYWIEMQQLVVQAKTPHELRYKPSDFGCRLKLWELITSDPFDLFIMICIVLNMFQMALDHDGASPGIILFLKLTNYFFTAVFFIECVLKLIVYKSHYFKTGWNKFDFFVVASSLIDLALELALPKSEGGQEDSSSSILSVGPQLARVMRVMRVTRVLRLAGKAKGLQSLLKTIIMSVDSLFNVFILLMLIFFIMAVLGNTMFFNITEGDTISDYKNFTNFHMSFSLLFSISTGEDWNRVMYDCMRTGPDCIPGQTCGSGNAPIFYLSFIMIVSNIMLNLFILVITQKFQQYYLMPDNPLSRFEEDFEDFKDAWKHFTEIYQCTKIRINKLKAFLMKLPLRMRLKMGIKNNCKEEEFDRIILKMNINVDDGFIYFNEMLYRIMRAQFVTGINLKFNKVMTINELKTQFQLAEIMLKEKQEIQDGKESKEAREDRIFSIHSAQPVNLFLTRMFYKTSFMTWYNYMIKDSRKKLWNYEQAENRAKAEIIGKTFIEPQYVEIEMPKVSIEIETEEELHMTASEEENEETYAGQAMVSHRMLSDWRRTSTAETPERFRLKARLRMMTQTLKFNKASSDFMAVPEINELKVSDMSSSKRQKRAMIAHSISELEEAQNAEWINPNSNEYQNVVMESKINSHQKSKHTVTFTNRAPQQLAYSGTYTRDKLAESYRLKSMKTLEKKIGRAKTLPSLINAPPKVVPKEVFVSRKPQPPERNAGGIIGVE